MAETNMNVRVRHKHDTETNWLKATGFSPKAGELIIYDPDSSHPYPRMKIGDGTTNVNNLVFAGAFAFGLPTPTTSDVGKFLRVNSAGAYELVAMANAEEATF